MEILTQIIKLLYRIRYWLIILPILAALFAIYNTRNLVRIYEVNTTIYTGIASGFTIESGLEGTRVDWNGVNNGIDNLISIIKARTTLREVSLRLYAQNMIYGDSIKDNNHIRASSYRKLVAITPRDVRVLINKNSEDSTVANLKRYERASPQNFVYGLFNWYHPHYSYEALKRIDVKRMFNSDMLDIKYSADDPGIAYNTLVILNEEFVKQYGFLRFGETNDVIDYFKRTLADLGRRLRMSEDSLTQYYIEKKIINYEEQTKQVSSLAKEYEIIYYDILLKKTSSTIMLRSLEDKIKDQARMMEQNATFVSKLNDISFLSAQIAKIELFNRDSVVNNKALDEYRIKLEDAEKEIKEFSNVLYKNRYSTEGAATATLVDQWITELIMKEKSTSELKVMDDVRRSLEDQYIYFAPIGSILKRMEREIGFTEQSYLSVQQSLNAALMRQKNLQMTSASLKPINPPLFPVAPIPTKRKAIVMATYFGTILLIIGLFVLIEIFDRTIRDKARAERIIKTPVLGAFPVKKLIRHRRYNEECKRIAINYLANSIVPYLNPKERPDIINFISTDDNTDKSHLISYLEKFWTERGLRVRTVTWHEGILNDNRNHILSSKLSDLFDYENEDLILVEHRSLRYSAIPVGLLREASLNLLTVRADKVWRDIDAIAFERLKEQCKSTPLMLYLTRTKNEVAENFLGLLPPSTWTRKMIYKLTQFGLTSK
ncbi:MAG TPA: exopolysaccharide biosynthesis protein [Rikenellaceae bacterium]|nr:exopolysaccharide biosynthesis protein [Rikenellaceae bacterium]